METFEKILAGVPQEIKTLEVDTEKKVFKLNGVNFGLKIACKKDYA